MKGLLDRFEDRKAVLVVQGVEHPVPRAKLPPAAKEGDVIDTETWTTGAPVLPECMANFECVTHHVFDAGDHRVYVGRVVKLRYDPDHEPLVYLQGRFRRVHVEAE